MKHLTLDKDDKESGNISASISGHQLTIDVEYNPTSVGTEEN